MTNTLLAAGLGTLRYPWRRAILAYRIGSWAKYLKAPLATSNPDTQAIGSWVEYA